MDSGVKSLVLVFVFTSLVFLKTRWQNQQRGRLVLHHHRKKQDSLFGYYRRTNAQQDVEAGQQRERQLQAYIVRKNSAAFRKQCFLSQVHCLSPHCAHLQALLASCASVLSERLTDKTAPFLCLTNCLNHIVVLKCNYCLVLMQTSWSHYLHPCCKTRSRQKKLQWSSFEWSRNCTLMAAFWSQSKDRLRCNFDHE